jgi:prepilin-type N-terminal cleavage/methylation domain-containing protein
MNRYAKDNRGFTLIELVMVLTMVGMLASIATPSYLNYIERARATQCHVDRGEVQNIIVQYYHDHSDVELQSLQQLVDEGYLHSGSNCPLGGEYVLIPAEFVDKQYPIVACSLHYLPEMVSQEEIGTPEEPDITEQPQTPEESGQPEEAGKPDKPDKPGKPEDPGKSNKKDKEDKGTKK